MNPYFIVVSHGKLGGGQSGQSGSLCEGESHALVLEEDAFAPTEEPLADGHFGFGLALPGREIIVVQRHDRVELAAKLA